MDQKQKEQLKEVKQLEEAIMVYGNKAIKTTYKPSHAERQLITRIKNLLIGIESWL